MLSPHVPGPASFDFRAHLSVYLFQICSFIMHLWHQTPPLELRMEACEGNDYDLLSTPAFNALEQTGTQ